MSARVGSGKPTAIPAPAAGRAAPAKHSNDKSEKRLTKSKPSRLPLYRAASPRSPQISRANPNAVLQKRIQRALNARLYLFSQTGPNAFLVADDGGTRYRVCLGSEQQCSCLQHQCVHLFFVMLRVLKVESMPHHCHLLTLSIVLQCRPSILSASCELADNSVKVSPSDPRLLFDRLRDYEVNALVQDFNENGRRFRVHRRNEHGDCRICLLQMDEGESLTSCAHCKNVLHKHCMSVWAQYRLQEGDVNVACPLCRSAWKLPQNPLSAKQWPTALNPPPCAVPVTAADISEIQLPYIDYSQCGSQKRARPWIEAFGDHLVACLLADKWQYREAALRKMRSHWQRVLVEKQEPKPFLQPSIEMLQLVLPDVVFKVYEVALSVLSLICRVATGSQFHLLGPPVEQIIGKCGDANKRVRAISMDAVFDFVDDDDSRIEFVVSRICKSGRDLYVSVTGEAGEADGQLPFRWWLGRLNFLAQLAKSRPDFFFRRPKTKSSVKSLPFSHKVRQWCSPAVDHCHRNVRKTAFFLSRQLSRLEDPSKCDSDDDCDFGRERPSLREFIANLKARKMTPCQREMAESADDDTDCTASEELALCLAAVASCQPETDSSSAMSTSSDDFGDEPVSRIIAGVYTYQSTGVSLKISPSYVQDNSWTKEKLLGTGAFSSAFVAVDKATGYRMAVKQLAYVRNTAEAEEQSLQVIAKEVDLMQKLGPHAHIVDFVGAVQESNHVNVFLEYLAGGCMSSYLAAHGALSLPVYRRFSFQLIDAVAFLHSNGVIHRDLKGANILLNEPCDAIKLCDFGTASSLSDARTRTAEFKSTHGTPAFMAPEVIRGECYGRRADVWSIGCCMIEMASGCSPWSDIGLSNQFALMYKIASTVDLPTIPDSLPAADRQFITNCLQRDCRQRPTAEEMLTCPLFADL